MPTAEYGSTAYDAQVSQLERAVEFAGYMATAAKRYMEVREQRFPEPDELRDVFAALGSAIYEFEKRAPRAK